MSHRHSQSTGGSITYGEAEDLLPVEALDASVSQYRDAERAVDRVAADEVITVSPTSLATGYALGRHPLSAIDVASLPGSIAQEIDDALETSISEFELIKIGNSSTDSPNHSLAEFADD